MAKFPQSVTINAGSIEVTNSDGTKRFYARRNVAVTYDATAGLFEFYEIENNQLVASVAAASLTIAGTSTATEKANWISDNLFRGVTGLVSGGATPTIAVGGSAGIGATATVTGNAVAGEITINTGTSPSATGILATVTLPFSMPTGCVVVFSPRSAPACQHSDRIYISAANSNLFQLSTRAVLTASLTAGYVFEYVVVGL